MTTMVSESPPVLTRPLLQRIIAHRSFFPALLVGMFLAITVPLVYTHPIWRDEGQAFLLARDSSTPWAMLQNMKYEGHPPLWHLMLWVLTRVTQRPEAMQWMHLILAAGTIFVMARWSPFPRPLQVVFTLGYFPLFEYAVLARNYGMVLLVTFAILAVWGGRRFSFVWYGVLLALLCFTHAMAIIIAGTIGLMLLLDTVATREGRRKIRRHYLRFALFIVISSGGAGLSILQTLPPADAAYAKGSNAQWDWKAAKETAESIWNAYVPLQRNDTVQFWNHNIVEDGEFAKAMKIDDTDAFRFKWATVLAAGAAACLIFSWRALLVYVPASLGLLAFLYIKLRIYAQLRHEGFLFVVLIAAFWIAWNPRDQFALAKHAVWRWTQRGLRAIPRVALFGLLLVHVAAAGLTVQYLWKYTFVPSKEAAETVQQLLKEHPDAPIVCGNQVIATAVAAYLPGREFYYPTMERWGTYTVWNPVLWKEARDDAILKFARAQKGPVIVIRCFNHQAVKGAKVIKDFPRQIEVFESFSIQLLPG